MAIPNDIDNRTPQQFFNTAAFVLQAANTFGSAGRNTINGPAFKLLDLSLQKTVNITQGTRLQFRIDMFNALNFVNFNIPNRNFGTPQFGTVTSARDARTMQFGAKFIF